MSDVPPPPPPEENDDIVVTGLRTSSVSTGIEFSIATFVVPTYSDAFLQEGGAEAVQVATIQIIDGDVKVRIVGYDFTLTVPAADWERMSLQQRGDFIKMMNEYRSSPLLVAAFNKLDALGVVDMPVRFDTVIHSAVDGSTRPWVGNNFELMSMAYDRMPDGSITNVRTILNINANLVPGSDGLHNTFTNTQGETAVINFALMFLHAVAHINFIGQSDMENQVRVDADRMYDDIFGASGPSTNSSQDYVNGQTIVGSMYGDSVIGSGLADTLSGLSGNDILNGGGGNDLVMGGSGMDRLSGGVGTNLVMGGLDADTYLPAAGVEVEIVRDIGGVDRLDLARFNLADATFSRYDDTLVISLSGTTFETVEIQGQWVSSGKIEQFVFADGTFAASFIESLSDPSTGPGVCYDPSGTAMICSPYFLPVVLDLDGDGIELIDVSSSRARFDVDGDRAWDRIGWAGPDDGLLVLDRNSNGRVDDASEFSFLQDFRGAGSDLEGLFAYDSDGDGFLTPADVSFSKFHVWRDRNGNGHSEKNEMLTLEELGIVSIGLERGNLNPLNPDAGANQIIATSGYRTSDGRTGLVGDVALFAEIGGCGCGSLGAEIPMVYAAEFVPQSESLIA